VINYDDWSEACVPMKIKKMTAAENQFYSSDKRLTVEKNIIYY